MLVTKFCSPFQIGSCSNEDPIGVSRLSGQPGGQSRCRSKGRLSNQGHLIVLCAFSAFQAAYSNWWKLTNTWCNSFIVQCFVSRSVINDLLDCIRNTDPDPGTGISKKFTVSKTKKEHYIHIVNWNILDTMVPFGKVRYYSFKSTVFFYNSAVVITLFSVRIKKKAGF